MRLKRFPEKEDVVALAQTIMGHERLMDSRLFRIFFYHAPPLCGQEPEPVTGDSDLIPTMKLARTEGLKVYVEALGNPIRREPRAHADLVL